ncbi:MAG: hypothetical protein U0401_24725 [Anaerolineae bacterium]
MPKTQPDCLVQGQNVAQLAVAWVLRNPNSASALMSASKLSQIEDIVACHEQS